MRLLERVARSSVVDALAAPHGIDRYLEIVNPMWAARDVRARVTEVRAETEGEHPVATIMLQPTSNWRGHRAGQYVQVGIELPGARRTTRCFTISSATSQPGEPFTVTVRAHAEGRVSRYLVEEARPGLVVHLSQAQGDFCLNESPATPTNNHLLFLTGGSGITPAMSMLRTLLRDGYDGHAGRKVTFLHYARSRADQIFAAELERIAGEANGVRVIRRYEADGDPRFSAIDLARLVPNFRDVDTWVCGPPALMELVERAYDDSPRLRSERFKPPLPTREGAGEEEGEVVFVRSGRSAANTGASLLEQAEAAGLNPESGCRMGICFSCTSRKTEGTVRNILTGEESSLPDEDIRICVSAPVGDCAVEL